jgi:hypothetical protein
MSEGEQLGRRAERAPRMEERVSINMLSSHANSASLFNFKSSIINHQSSISSLRQ